MRPRTNGSFACCLALGAAYLVSACAIGPTLAAPARDNSLTCASAFLKSKGYAVDGPGRLIRGVNATRTTVARNSTAYLQWHDQDIVAVKVQAGTTDSLRVTFGSGSESRTLDDTSTPTVNVYYKKPSPAVKADADSLLARCSAT